jgi:hypothetical protein
VFLDGSFFLGLAYPAGYNVVQERTVFLRHHPGVRLGPEWWASRVAVLGAADGAGVERAFRTYVDSFRRRPRSFTVYNSWYDVRYPELTTEVLLGPAAVPTPRPGLSRTAREIQARRRWRRPPAAQAALELRDLSHLRAAKLRVRVFGVQGLGEETITLNGVSLGRLPPTATPSSRTSGRSASST